MSSLLNVARPPVFCPGCSHDRITHVLDKAFQNMGLSANQIAMVSDIGCSGLFDTFFNTHAIHGLHGRALTYATGLKMTRPELNVVVTMGDGGQGIGGAHLLAACRRNLNITLLVLNNFNFGMTGGQFSATTPPEAQLGSGYLNQLEQPLDICQVARCAGAPYVTRCSAFRKDLAEEIQRAVEFNGFAVIDMWGICPGRYTQKNRLTPRLIDEALLKLPPQEGVVAGNVRKEYGQHYRELATSHASAPPLVQIDAVHVPPQLGRQDVILLGSAGQRIITAGEILCLAGLFAGLHTTQKNEYDIMVLRGPSVSELILSPEKIDFTGIEHPSVIVALGQEGIDRRQTLFTDLTGNTIILNVNKLRIPPTNARIHAVDIASWGIKSNNWALAALAVLAKLEAVVTIDMLKAALNVRFDSRALEEALMTIEQVKIDQRAW